MKLNKKGFTLAELLIVIAIIAILIAIAIPVFSSQLDNAKLQADHANLRSAYALVQTANLIGKENVGTEFDVDAVYQTDGTFGKSGTPVTAQAGGKHVKDSDHPSCQTCVADCATIFAAENAQIKIAAGDTAGTYKMVAGTPAGGGSGGAPGAG